MSHLLDGLNSLPDPFKGKPRIACILSAILIECDALSKVFAHIDLLRDVETADRLRLVQIAQHQGESSRPESTELLRRIVLGRIFANNTDGSLRSLMLLHKILFGVTNRTFRKFPPKYLQIRQTAASLPVFEGNTTQEIMQIYVGLLEACGDPGLLIEIYIEPTHENTEFPGYLPQVYRSTP